MEFPTTFARKARREFVNIEVPTQRGQISGFKARPKTHPKQTNNKIRAMGEKNGRIILVS